MVRKRRVLWESFRLDYFRRLPTYRLSKRWLSVACAAIAALWIGLAAARDDQAIYSSGSMSAGHEQLADRCSVCHEVPYRGLTFLVNGQQKDLAMNEACLKCHGHRIGFHSESMTAVHQETSARGIRANCIGPGLIDTEMTTGIGEVALKAYLGNLPLGRIGTPEDIAGAAVYLASDASSYVNGQLLKVCGGYLMA